MGIKPVFFLNWHKLIGGVDWRISAELKTLFELRVLKVHYLCWNCKRYFSLLLVLATTNYC